MGIVPRMRTTTSPRGYAVFMLLWALLNAAGCAPKLIPTPHVMIGTAGREHFEQIDPSLRTSDIPVFYYTDRVPDRQGPHGPEYGYDRSHTTHFGVATVSISPDVPWEELVADSITAHRSRVYTLRLNSVEELGTIRPMQSRYTPVAGKLRFDRAALDNLHADQARVHEALNRWLDVVDRKDALVFVHGYNNTFDNAVIRIAEAWHLGGRDGVPIVYTWPAGSGGLKGYAYDRESGEFTIVHLKMLLWTLARHPRIERVHILSHSRGTDVATTALREMNAEIRGGLGGAIFTDLAHTEFTQSSAKDIDTPAELLKIQTLVLAAPDLDLDVFIQRFFGENLLRIAQRVVIYFSKNDEALGLADWLFRSRARLGALKIEQIPLESRHALEQIDTLEMINCDVTGHTSHSYVLQHPAALSDVITLLRTGAPAGSPDRPLRSQGQAIWELNNDYLKTKLSSP